MYTEMSGEAGIKRTGRLFDEMHTKFKELYKCDAQFAKEYGGVHRHRIFSSLETPLHPFPNPDVNGIIALRERLLDRTIGPMKLLGKDEYTRFK